MARSFIAGDEIMNKSDFNKKIQIDAVYNHDAQFNSSLHDLNNEIPNDANQHNFLQIGQVGYIQDDLTLGNFAPFLIIGRANLAGIISFSLDNARVRFSLTQNGKKVWAEDLVMASKFNALQDRVSALEKQIGGSKAQ